MLGLVEMMGYIVVPPKKMLKERQGFYLLRCSVEFFLLFTRFATAFQLCIPSQFRHIYVRTWKASFCSQLVVVVC